MRTLTAIALLALSITTEAVCPSGRLSTGYVRAPSSMFKRRTLAMQASVGDKAKAPSSNLVWDSHQAVEKAPDSLVRSLEGNESMRRRFEQACRQAQLSICKAVEDCDGGAKFHADAWVRADGGGGISMVLKDGKVWEKAGCNLSVVYGTMPQEALQAATERGVDRAKGMKPGK